MTVTGHRTNQTSNMTIWIREAQTLRTV